MAYDIKFRTETQGAESVEQLRAKVLLLQNQYKSAATDVKQAVDRIADAEKQANAAIQAGHTQLAAAIRAAVESEKAALDSLIRKELELKSAVDAVSGAHSHLVPQVAAASAAIRTFEGSLPIRAVERFAVTTLGLGPALQAIFPIVGAVALGEVIVKAGDKVYELAKAWDPVLHAEEQAKEAAEEYGKEIHRIGEEIRKLDLEALEKALGKSAGKAVGADQLSRQASSDRGVAAILQSQLDKANSDQALAEASAKRSGQAPQTIATALKDAQRLRAEADTLRQQIAFFQTRATKSEAEASKLVSESAEAQQSDNDKAKRAGAKDFRADEQGQKREFDDELKTLEAYYGKHSEIVIRYLNAEIEQQAKFPDLQRSINEKLLSVLNERDQAIEKIAERGAKLEEEQAKRAEKQLSFLSQMADEADTLIKKSGDAIVESAAKLANIQTRGREQSELGSLGVQRLGIRRAGGLTGDSAGERLSARLAEYQKLRDLDQKELDARLRAEQEILDRFKSLGEKHVDDVAKQENKIAEIKARAAEKSYEDETRYLQEIHQARERELGAFRSEVGSVFDAIVNRSLPQLLRSQGLNLAKTIVENLAVQELLPAIQKHTPHAQEGTFFGKILQNTPFGPDPVARSTEANTAATIENTNALNAIARIAASPSGGGGGLSATPPTFGSVFSGAHSNPFVFNGFPDYSDSGIVGSAPTGPFAPDLIMTGKTNPKGIGFNGQTIGSALAIGGGALEAFSGFSHGGARGALQGTAGVLGSAAGIAALIPGGQVAAIGLGIAAAATSFVSAILPDPKQVREKGITKALEQNKYYAPEALNVTQSTSGTFADFDARGNLRQSNFSPFPLVSDPYQWWKGQTPYDVPGRVNSPYGAPVAAPTTIIIQAADAQSFNDMAQRNKDGLADAVASHLQNSDSRLTAAVRFVTSN